MPKPTDHSGCVNCSEFFELKISVCLATCNGSSFIEEQLKSVLDQLLPGDEVVVADDGSFDDTLAIIRSFSGPIRIVAESRVGGVVQNFQRVISAAKGEAIVLCDQDDVWLPGRLDLFREHLQQCDLVLLNGVLIDQGGRVLGRTVFDVVGMRPGFLPNLLKNSFIGCCMGFRSGIREQILPFPKDLPWHDWYIGLFVELTGKVFRSGEISLYYRRHRHNASSTGSGSGNHLFKRLSMRIQMLKALWLACSRGSPESRRFGKRY